MLENISSCILKCKHLTLAISMLNYIFPLLTEMQNYHLKYSTTRQDHCCLLHLRSSTCHEIGMMDDTRLCHFCSYNAIENEAHLVLECPLYKPIRDKFPSLFDN